MFPMHNPAQEVFSWHCRSNNIPEAEATSEVIALREPVSLVRRLYKQPIGRTISYDDADFRSAYLLAYFPYYIEPLYYVLKAARLPDTLFTDDTLNVAFFGGGPCPEILGLAAYLRERAPHLHRIAATVFDREPGWNPIRQGLLTTLLPLYQSGCTTFDLQSKSCDVIECLSRKCACGIADRDVIIAQNFLTEVCPNSARTLNNFERLIRGSACRYLIVIDNIYDQVKDMMNELSARLFDKGLTRARCDAATQSILTRFPLPRIMQEHLFIGGCLLQPKYKVHFHHMVLEIKR